MNPLIVYYSYSGITRKLVEDIALITDGELQELEPQDPYSFSYNTAVKEVRAQIEKGYCPQLCQGLANIDDFETIFIGSPNWLKTFAPPVLSFLRTTDLSGKTIIPFCTHEGSGDAGTVRRIQSACPKATVLKAFSMRGQTAQKSRDSAKRDTLKWLGEIKVN